MGQSLYIEIETTDRELERDMFETSAFSAGETQVALSDGSIATWSGGQIKKSFGAPEVFSVVMSLATSLGTGIAGNWLYDKLKGRPAKLRINRTEVEIEPNKIRIVIEHIEKDG